MGGFLIVVRVSVHHHRLTLKGIFFGLDANRFSILSVLFFSLSLVSFGQQIPRHYRRPLHLVRGEPRRCGGPLSSLPIDSRGLASRTCPRIDPIVRAIAHSCARDGGTELCQRALRAPVRGVR